MKGKMDRFRMVQLSPDNARLELFDRDKSLGYFWTPKMANLKIKEILDGDNGSVVIKEEPKTSSTTKTVQIETRQRGRRKK